MTLIIPDPKSAPADQGHEDATVYSSAVVLHPLPGTPRFEGVLTGPAGPMARLRDGDLVLRADLATITAWAAALETARKQLTTTTTDAESEAR
ncbi:hypothetical protein GCM10022254_09140 [Actinomadura meridiana]|uniref:Uncharacterized protein n=1 Tax=Actinomadura meridiana TaxID=559626 RepID=A0ABP8BTT2_9ACTN